MSSVNAPRPLLEMRDITKTFPGVRALAGVTFDLRRGELHALVGENGAGKSTLMKVLSGVYPHGSYGGEIVIDGEERHFRNVRDAEAAGVAIIFQELSLIRDLSVGENIFLGREPHRYGVIRWGELYRRAGAILEELRLTLDPRTPVGQLGIGQQQLVEIAKALSQEARILVLDEPTRGIDVGAKQEIYTLVNQLAREGLAIVLVSSELPEVLGLSDRVIVLHEGRVTGEFTRADATPEKVMACATGQEGRAA